MLKKLVQFVLLCNAICLYINANAQDSIVRKEIATINFNPVTVRKVDVKEISFKPSQHSGYHKHPCTVISYIVSGTVLFQVEGDSSKVVTAGNVIYEPANTPIVHFDNFSQTDSLKFIPYYFLNKDTTLIEMLGPKK